MKVRSALDPFAVDVRPVPTLWKAFPPYAHPMPTLGTQKLISIPVLTLC